MKDWRKDDLGGWRLRIVVFLFFLWIVWQAWRYDD